MNDLTNAFTPIAKKVLSGLELNAREPFSKIARATKVSEQLVKYHVHRAKEEGFISGFHPIFVPESLGFTMYIVYLRFFGASRADELKWQASCARIRGVMVIAQSFGRWNGFVAVWARNPGQLESVITEISQSMAGKIEEMQITTRLNSHYATLSILHDSTQKICRSLSTTSSESTLDQKDYKILRCLADDARISAASISEKISLSPTAVISRIQKLEERKIINGYRAMFKYSKLGYTQFSVLFKLVQPSSALCNKIMKGLFETGCVHLVTRYLGFADFDARCYARSLEELDSLIAGIRDKFVNDILQFEIVPLLSMRYVDHLPIGQ